jgi:hypothetical protein
MQKEVSPFKTRECLNENIKKKRRINGVRPKRECLKIKDDGCLIMERASLPHNILWSFSFSLFFWVCFISKSFFILSLTKSFLKETVLFFKGTKTSREPFNKKEG